MVTSPLHTNVSTYQRFRIAKRFFYRAWNIWIDKAISPKLKESANGNDCRM